MKHVLYRLLLFSLLAVLLLRPATAQQTPNPAQTPEYATPWILPTATVQPTVTLAATVQPTVTPAAETVAQAQTQHRVLLPLVLGEAWPPSPFGFDVRDYARDDVLSYAREARPRWVRAGDVMWADVEPEPGVYNWAALAAVEANVARTRAQGLEPVLIVQRSPAWAQRTPGRLCSPPRAEHIDEFARFMQVLSARFANSVYYWEIWNEPDFSAPEVQDWQGFGCWADPSMPFYGGAYYGEVLKQVYPAVKAGNPRATVLAGALAYFWPDDTVSRDFLNGILASGAGNSFDALSFHAYGEYGASDLLLSKTLRIRSILANYGMAHKPLFATEISATCFSALNCPNNFIQRQANYAARIYAIALALDLYGAFWFSLVASGPEVIINGQLIDDAAGTLTPRPSYHSFRNSALLLQGAKYIGPPVVEPPPSQIGEVQVLPFRKGTSTLYVFWVPRTDFPKVYNLPVPVGATAICTDQLNQPTPATYYCSDTNHDGVIPRAVNELPQYVEVVGQ